MAALFINIIHNPSRPLPLATITHCHRHTHTLSRTQERNPCHGEKMLLRPTLEPFAGSRHWYTGWCPQIIQPEPSYKAPVSCNSLPDLQLVSKAVPLPGCVNHGLQPFTQKLAVSHTTGGSLTSHKNPKWACIIEREKRETERIPDSMKTRPIECQHQAHALILNANINKILLIRGCSLLCISFYFCPLMQPWQFIRWRICLRHRRPGFHPWVGKIPWRRAWQPTPVFLPAESHGQRSLVGTVHGVTESQTPLSN